MSATTITQPDEAERRAGRRLWILRTHNSTPGVGVFDHLVIDDKATELLISDLAQWASSITATTERLVAEVHSATAVA